jgi:hypothetical protein
MAKYATTKTLKKAVPTIRLDDGVVKKWTLEVVFTGVESGWRKIFEHTEDVEYMEKLPEDFTAAELMNFLPKNREHIFDAHYEANNSEPTEETLGTFSVKDLAPSANT